MRNAAEASGGDIPVEISAAADDDGWLRIVVADRGPGLSATENLFVPFFTTKPSGSGIGLALCRAIVEAHGGQIILRNRVPGPGAEAVLQLPLSL